MGTGQVNAESPWTIRRLITWTTDYFAQAGLDEPRLSAEILLSAALQCQRIELYTRFEHQPDADALTRFRDSVRQAAAHTPIAYIVGCKEFFSLRFAVSPAVLIPRPETELLVEQAIDVGRSWSKPGGDILEVGTGSGCIAVSIARHLPDARIVATDISDDALAIARQNAGHHGVAERIRFVSADRFHLPANIIPPGGFDLIVSNPPYVSRDEMHTLPANVRDHEPHAALTDERDGLSFYRALAAAAQTLLAPTGSILVEVADGRSTDVQAVMRRPGLLAIGGAWTDVGGKHQRVLRFDRTPTASRDAHGPSPT